MAWYDKPTDGQTGALLHAYDPYLLEELDHAKKTGAYIKAQALEEMEKEDILLKAIKRLAENSNRAIFSKLIERADREHYIDPSIQRAIDTWLWGNYYVQLDYERARKVWAEERERCRVN